VPREETTTSRSHLTLPEIRFPSPVHGYPGLSPDTARPLSQGAGGGRGSGRAVGVSHEYRSTRDTGDRGGGSRIRLPPPPQPPPPGGDSPIDTVSREETTTSRSHLILPEIRFPFPVHGYPDYRHALPAPSRRGREEALMSGRAAGGSHEYRSTIDAGDRGGSGQS